MSTISSTDLLSDHPLSHCPDHISSPFGLFYTHASRVQKFFGQRSRRTEGLLRGL